MSESCTEDEPMDDPDDTEGTGPAAKMDSDHEERELELGWRRRLRVRSKRPRVCRCFALGGGAAG